MSLYAAAILVRALSRDPAVTALVGDRIYVDRMPQVPDLPAIVLQCVSAVEGRSLDGGVAGPTDERVQHDAYARTRGETWAIAEAIRQVYLDEPETLWPLDVDGARGHWARPDGVTRDQTEPETRLLRTSIDYRVSFTRTL